MINLCLSQQKFYLSFQSNPAKLGSSSPLATSPASRLSSPQWRIKFFRPGIPLRTSMDTQNHAAYSPAFEHCSSIRAAVRVRSETWSLRNPKEAGKSARITFALQPGHLPAGTFILKPAPEMRGMTISINHFVLFSKSLNALEKAHNDMTDAELIAQYKLTGESTWLGMLYTRDTLRLCTGYAWSTWKTAMTPRMAWCNFTKSSGNAKTHEVQTF